MNVRTLFRNIESNFWKDIEVWPIGLANSPGSMPLWGGGTGASLVAGWAGISLEWKQTIAVNTLDNILGSRFWGKRLFIKVDVEGAEYDLLKGASKTLQNDPQPIWIVEISLSVHRPKVNQNFGSTFKIFWDLGYSVYTANSERKIVTESDVKYWESTGIESGCNNWLFIPKQFTNQKGGIE